jgi:predicted Rdx family selenoprotein
MLRAAYFGQELLSTFGTTIGEIALIPATGGLFTVTLSYIPQPIGEQRDGSKDSMQPQTVLLWDRKAEGGFPGVSQF